MSEDRFERLFADLDAQFAAQEQQERQAEYGTELQLQWADRTLAARLAGAVDVQVDIAVGNLRLNGVVREVTSSYVVLQGADMMLVATAKIADVRLPVRVHRDADLAAGLGWGSPLRRIKEAGAECSISYGDDRLAEGVRIHAVARDYLQVHAGSAFQLIPFAALTVVRTPLGAVDLE